jgi:hypothetical protein
VRKLTKLAAQARELAADLAKRHGDQALAAARDSLAADLNREVTPAQAADVLAQAVVCAAAILQSGPSQAAVEWLSRSASAWERWVLSQASSRTARTEYLVLSTEYRMDAHHLYEHFLHAYAPTTRRRHGVFFTPQPIAHYIVREIDRTLQDDFNLPAGLASHSAIRTPHSALEILDPACGTGVFLLAVIDRLHRRLASDWNEFVPDLLPRLTGIELLPVPALLAKLNLALKLSATGYHFREPGTVNIRIGDALSPNLQSAICNLQFAIPVLLGNPPFSSLSTNTNPWIASLVRGNGLVRGYVQAGEHRLGERKTWLYDDYVKFIRLAQWHVEAAGQGIVGLVTSRGYLDNATFRLMRQELLRVFPHIQLVDLHGSRKGGEQLQGGRRDENVFGLDQGVAIGIFGRPTPTRSVSEGVPPNVIEHAEIWGSRDEKIGALADSAPSLTRRATMLDPQPPHWLFVPAKAGTHPEYAAAWSLAEAMPLNVTAPVTARDHFVVAFSRKELHERISELCDLSIPDETIRAKYFTRTRSSRYPSGDTRSWKLAAARRAVAADDQWPAKIVRCLYRPFDWRYVFWHPAMIDWPRTAVTRHLLSGNRESSKLNGTLNLEPETLNLCLIARRQQLPTQPCTYFWIADCLALDGVIRSDNRGSESLFPLQVGSACRAVPEHTQKGPPGRRRLHANFAPALFEQATAIAGGELSAEDLLAYIYALFHSPTYRERYAAELRPDFPRVLLPARGKLLLELAALGQRLIDAHLLRGVEGVGSLWPNTVFNNGRPLPAKDSRPLGVDLRVGGYDALRKWLQPKHRSADDPDCQRIAAAITLTHQIIPAIDAAIERHGGFPAAFSQGGRESLAEEVSP